MSVVNKKIDSVKIIVSRLMGVHGLNKPIEVADKLGVTSQVLNNWLKRNSPAAIKKIREIVEEDKIDFVLYGEDEKSPSTPEGEKASKIVSEWDASDRDWLLSKLYEATSELKKRKQ